MHHIAPLFTLSPVAISLMAFCAAASLLMIVPGLDTANVMRASTFSGPRIGFSTLAGICGGLLVWGVCTAFGLTAIFAASATAYTVLKWGGAGYLMFLGVKLLLNPRKTIDQGPADRRQTKSAGGAFRSGLLTNLLNPKVGFFHLTFFPQFIPHGVSVAGFSLLLTVVHVTLAFIWFSFLIAMTVPLGRFLNRPRVVQWMDRMTGGIFIAFGVKLAATD